MKPIFHKKERLNAAPGWQPTIKWKIVAALMAFTGIIILILWLFQVVFLENMYENIKYRQLKVSAQSILKSSSEENLEKRASRYSSKYEICILVYNSTADEIVCSKDNLKNCFMHRYLIMQKQDGSFLFNKDLALRYRQKAIAEGGQAYIINQQYEFREHLSNSEFGAENDQDKSVMMVLTTQNQSGDEIVIFLNSILKPVTATVTTLNSMLAIISILILMIAIALGLAISYNIAKPIDNITKGARRLANGNYEVSFQGNGYLEIDELASTMNYAASELSKVDQLKNDLISNISHDLRTPLTLITGYAEMMRDLPDETTPENLQIIIDEADRMKNLVNDVLDISKIQSGTNQFEMQDFPLTNCIESELTRYNKLRDMDGYSIQFHYDQMVTVTGDCTCIMRAVYNLVNNAVTHAGEDKRIIVEQTIDEKQKNVRISITDHGEGIEEDKLDLIWERYYKVDRTHKRAQIGTGLGLSIVKNIIEAHHGSYGVTSTVGKGSTFFFELPFQKSEPIDQSDENGGIEIL